jgi:hypothetical protein
VKIVLLVEGDTEKSVLPGFFQRWLKGKVDPLPGIFAVNAKGCDKLLKACAQKAAMHLDSRDVLGVIGLIDLHGPECPPHCTTTDKRRDYLRELLEKEVDSPRFRQHFAIHELEAWLLSDPNIFPPAVKKALPRKVHAPEQCSGPDLPGALLARLYREKTAKDYKKRVHGSELFAKLDPTIAADKCPALAALLGDLLDLARTAA